jgi:ABC-type sugar transport system ATPase subunit
VDDQMNRLRIKTTSPSTLITSLSGGNQQKVLVARWLASAPRILIMDEPTRGIDVETKAEIYHLMRELTKHNIAIMMISSDLMEILEISDRILVMYEGSLTGEFRHDQATEETIMACATGTENRPSKHINA